MQAALEEANVAFLKDEVPIGAVVVYDGQIIGRGRNMTREKNDPTLHAEIVAIRQACEVMGAQRIPECDLYVTLEPCTMCAGAISFARINTLYVGAQDAKGGGVLNGVCFYDQPTCHHRPAVEHSILVDECSAILKRFFKEKREAQKSSKHVTG